MFQVGQIVAPLTADLRDFTRGIASAKMKGANAAKDIRKSFQDIGRGMQNIGRNMTMGITAPLVGAGALAVKTAADYERLQIQLNTLAGSAEEGAKAFEQLKEFSAGTPFQMQDLVKANNILVGMGQTMDEAFTNIQMLGDVASATGANINELAITFGQASAEGKLMTRDIREFINRGVPMTKLLADSMGVAKNEIFDLAEQGKISFEVVRQALEDATTGTGIYAGATEDAANSIHGVLSTMRDNANALLADIGNSIVETFDVKGIIKDLTSSLQSAVKWFDSLSVEGRKTIFMLTGFAAAIGPISWAMGTLLTQLPKVTRGFKALTAVMMKNPYVAVAAGITAIGIGAYKTLTELRPLRKEIEKILQTDIAVDQLKEVEEGIENTKDKIEDLRNSGRQGILGDSMLDVQRIEELEGKLRELEQRRKDIRMELLRQDIAGTNEEVLKAVDVTSLWQASMGGVTESTNEWASAQENANKYLKETRDLLPKLQPENLGNMTGSISAMRDELIMLQAAQNQVNLTTDAGKAAYSEIGVLIADLQAKIAELTGSTQEYTDGLNQSAQMAAFFGQQLGQAFAQAIVFGDKLGDSIKNIGKQLASRGIVNFLGLAMSGGLGGLFSGGILGGIGKLFGGIFHGGGIVPGQGEKMILAKGGEMVLTQSQQKALSVDRSSGISASQMSKAFEMALDRKLSKLSSDEMYAFVQKGRRGF